MTENACSSTCKAPPRYPRDQILATLYGQAVGDAMGLLTEFLSKEEVQEHYKDVKKHLEFEHKDLCKDFHRTGWDEGDWTDDTDQMVLILQSLVENDGQIKPEDFAKKLTSWARRGFPELGDFVGMGIGKTTKTVIAQPDFITNPHKAASDLYNSGQRVASNGAVMRTSILGIHQYWDTETVAQNALDMGKSTHYDPRCQASCVAVSVAISLMLKRERPYLKWNGKYSVKKIIQHSYEAAEKCIPEEEGKLELKKYMEVKEIKELNLEDVPTIGYTLKCMGAGFWALKQTNFRKAIQTVVLEGGDADTNSAVAGALLGCKLGLSALPRTWVSKLKNKVWLDEQIEKYFLLMEKLMK